MGKERINKMKLWCKDRYEKLICNKVFWVTALLMTVCTAIATSYGRAKTLSNKTKKKEIPIYCVDTEKKYVALSFDAAWGNEDTEKILEILKKHNVRVTFFMTGGWVESYPDDVKKIAKAGHDLGNHSENHKHMSQLSTGDIQLEIMKVHDKVKNITGINMELFRPPYGDYNNTLITTMNSLKYYTIQWSVDSLDWKNYGVQNIIDTVLNHKNLTNGAIILMHNGAKYTAEALDSIISGLINKGYELIPISELIYKNDYSIDHTGKQIKK